MTHEIGAAGTGCGARRGIFVEFPGQHASREGFVIRPEGRMNKAGDKEVITHKKTGGEDILLHHRNLQAAIRDGASNIQEEAETLQADIRGALLTIEETLRSVKE